MKILCVIPSRIGSTRMPRKPLLPIQGKPMVQRVYENALRCKVFSKVIVATDNLEIADIIKNMGGNIAMTDPDIQTGSDRVAAVAKDHPDMDVVVNLQGDEPFIKPRMLEQLVAPYLRGELPDMTTLAYPLDMNTRYHEASAVKVITDLSGNALYFSRSPIPYLRQSIHGPIPVYHHIGLYAFRRDFLLHFTSLPQTPLEQTESLEQLRALEHGFRIRVCLTEDKTLEINTPEEYELAQSFVYSD
ncbi:MAG: 3-deoxy-manno-octulosonate cytidylyltransferase [Gammaproteobacteria bacterium]